jgi:hypothetical protein
MEAKTQITIAELFWLIAAPHQPPIAGYAVIDQSAFAYRDLWNTPF